MSDRRTSKITQVEHNVKVKNTTQRVTKVKHGVFQGATVEDVSYDSDGRLIEAKTSGPTVININPNEVPLSRNEGQVMSVDASNNLVFIDSSSGIVVQDVSYDASGRLVESKTGQPPIVNINPNEVPLTRTDGQVLSVDGTDSLIFIDPPSGGGGSAVNLSGDTEVYRGATNYWTITNLDSFSNYTLTTPNNVTGSINGNLLLMVVDVAFTGSDLIFIVSKNGEDSEFTATVIDEGIVVPIITNPTANEEIVDTTPLIRATGFQAVPDGRVVHTSSQFQISETIDFAVIRDDSGVLPPISVWDTGIAGITPLEAGKVYFVRVRYTGTTLRTRAVITTDWSPIHGFSIFQIGVQSWKQRAAAQNTVSSSRFTKHVAISKDFRTIIAMEVHATGSSIGTLKVFRDGLLNKEVSITAEGYRARFTDNSGIESMVTDDEIILVGGSSNTDSNSGARCAAFAATLSLKTFDINIQQYTEDATPSSRTDMVSYFTNGVDEYGTGFIVGFVPQSGSGAGARAYFYDLSTRVWSYIDPQAGSSTYSRLRATLRTESGMLEVTGDGTRSYFYGMGHRVGETYDNPCINFIAPTLDTRYSKAVGVGEGIVVIGSNSSGVTHPQYLPKPNIGDTGIWIPLNIPIDTISGSTAGCFSYDYSRNALIYSYQDTVNNILQVWELSGG